MSISPVFALVDGRKLHREVLRSFLQEIEPEVRVVAVKNSEELFELLSLCPLSALFIHNNITTESGIDVARHIGLEPALKARNMKLVIYGDARVETVVQKLGGSFICTEGSTKIFVDRFCVVADALRKDC